MEGVARKPAPKPVPYLHADKKTVTYRVRIRINGQQSTETFDELPAAQTFCERVADPNIGAAEAVRMRDLTDKRSVDHMPTVAEMFETHLDLLTGIEQRTKDDYRSEAARGWLPMLGAFPVDAIEDIHVSRFINSRDGQVAPKTIKNEHSLLSAVLETAVRKGKITLNPARGARLPRTGEEEVIENRYLSHAEFDQLYNATPDYYRAFMVTLFGTGLRFSEITALQVKDISMENGSLRVVRAWKKQKGIAGGRKLGPPKSKASRRTILLPKEVAWVLDPLVTDRPGSDWLFVTVTGLPVRHSNFYNRVWRPACIAAGLDPRPRIHDARHTHASWLIAKGIRLEVVQDRLGHDDYNITRRTYGHLLPDLRIEAAQAASAAFANTTALALPAGRRST